MATLKQQKARKEYKCDKCGNKIKKGEQYLRFSISRFSPLKPICLNCRPKPSEMTQSDFLSQVYEIDERIEGMTIEDDFESEIEEIKSELENLQSECEEKRDNMPEQLQDAPTGELLQGRYDSIDEMISELDGIDTECDEEAIKGDLEQEDDETEEAFDEKVQEAIEERKEEILSEIQGVSYNGE